ncbi:hypothetical protein LCGC14_0723080 [marine sediment metagenome]|uniref:Uncharacterized protein n=1 Tax=marine sediment metagenome TaxID=412755 RepID=A0A0F9QWR2_9ZZZZ
MILRATPKPEPPESVTDPSDFLARLEDLEGDSHYSWTWDTITGIYDTVERAGHVTAGQLRAIDNIQASAEDVSAKPTCLTCSKTIEAHDGYQGHAWKHPNNVTRHILEEAQPMPTDTTHETVIEIDEDGNVGKPFTETETDTARELRANAYSDSLGLGDIGKSSRARREWSLAREGYRDGHRAGRREGAAAQQERDIEKVERVHEGARHELGARAFNAIIGALRAQ